MPSSCFVRTPPMKIWCFLILFTCFFGLTTSLRCYRCELIKDVSDCETTQVEEECGGDLDGGHIRVCNARFGENNWLESKGCGEAVAGTKYGCKESEKTCVCTKELCNDWKEMPKFEKKTGSSKGLPKPWNYLLWIGLVCIFLLLARAKCKSRRSMKSDVIRSV